MDHTQNNEKSEAPKKLEYDYNTDTLYCLQIVSLKGLMHHKTLNLKPKAVSLQLTLIRQTEYAFWLFHHTIHTHDQDQEQKHHPPSTNRSRLLIICVN